MIALVYRQPGTYRHDEDLEKKVKETIEKLECIIIV